jgi:pyridoxine 5-phosphate synthase
MSTKLSININKIALLRNARGGQVPDLLKFALDCANYGADGITIHPRQDQRHITFDDVKELAQLFPKDGCEFNIEGYPSDHFIEMVLAAKPTQVTLVPDAVNQLTSDHGWDVKPNYEMLKEVLSRFKAAQIRTAIFIDPVPLQLALAKEVGTDRIELYTGPYAEEFQHAIQINADLNSTVKSYKNVEGILDDLGLGVNAGHDLNLENLKYFKENVPSLLEVSIGQAFVRDCLYYGLENTIQMYKRLLV